MCCFTQKKLIKGSVNENYFYNHSYFINDHYTYYDLFLDYFKECINFRKKYSLITKSLNKNNKEQNFVLALSNLQTFFKIYNLFLFNLLDSHFDLKFTEEEIKSEPQADDKVKMNNFNEKIENYEISYDYIQELFQYIRFFAHGQIYKLLNTDLNTGKEYT